MLAGKNMATSGLVISSSIANFREALEKKYGGIVDKTIFFGLYHERDYKRFIFAKSPTVVWCGSDILALRKHPIWRRIIRRKKAEHICENEVEQAALISLGIWARVQPLFFGNPGDYPMSFKPSEKPQVYLNAHQNRGDEYGVGEIMYIALQLPDVMFHIYGVTGLNTFNVIFHGRVPSEQFDEEIKNYQAALRLNEFDGFGEVTAKSILMGQYPITKIKYPHIDQAKTKEDLIRLLQELKNKKEPNPARGYWVKELSKPL